jgi:hypothetical protein
VQNNSVLFGVNITIVGYKDVILLENNQSIIPYESLKIKNVIFQNTKSGEIISSGKM